MPKCLEKRPFCDQKWVKNGSKMRFSKTHPGSFEGLKQVFFAHFVPVGTRFGPWKIPTCLEKGPFCDQKRVKSASKSDFGPFGVLKQVFLAHFEPVETRFGPWKIPKCRENGCFGTRKGSTTLRKEICGPFTVLKQVFSAHFELVVTRFGPWKMPKCLEKRPFCDQKWVKNALLQNSSRITREAQTSVFGPF